MAPEKRTTAALLKMLDFDFFEVLDSVTIARSRKHIEKYYNMDAIGKFPERLKPVSLHPNLTDLDNAINYNEIYDELMKLNLAVYIPTDYIFESRRDKYVDPNVNINRAGREQGIRRLMSINLLKRLESSVYSFRLTLQRIKKLIDDTIAEIDIFESGGDADVEMTEFDEDADFDYDDQNTDFFTTGRKIKIDLNDMDYVTWRAALQQDSDVLEQLTLMVAGASRRSTIPNCRPCCV